MHSTSARPHNALTPRNEPRHLLGISLEDYFHVGAFRHLISRSRWPRLESCLEHATNTTLALLAEHRAKATFFTLGWVAENFPELVRRVVELGHEVANSGFSHQGVAELGPEALRDDLQRGHDAIAAATGRMPLGTRISDWIREEHLWALDVVAGLGYAYDASLRPLGTDCRAHSERRYPFDHVSGGRRLREFPVPTMRLGPLLVPIGGGNWIRQLPEPVVRHAIERWHETRPDPFSMYFHVWELDSSQPRITAASWLATARHYRNMDHTERVVRRFLAQRPFVGYAEYLGLTPKPGTTTETGSVPARASRDLPNDGNSPAGQVPVTAIVPCFNEAETLPYLLNTLTSVSRELRPRYQLSYIFVDDGSSDDTWQVLQWIAGQRADCKIVRHAVNKGVAHAILTGIATAQDEFVCSIDADCTYDPHQLADLLALLEGGADLVTASPYHPDGRVRHVAWWRRFLSRTLSTMYARRLRSNLHTYTSCFRAYRRSRFAGLSLSHRGFLGIAEIMARALLGGLRVAEVPATLEVRLLGQSKLRVLCMIAGHLQLLREVPQWRRANAMTGAAPIAATSSAAGAA